MPPCGACGALPLASLRDAGGDNPPGLAPGFLLALQLAQLDEGHGRHDGVVEGVVGFALG
jgi:hypothetical protein